MSFIRRLDQVQNIFGVLRQNRPSGATSNIDSQFIVENAPVSNSVGSVTIPASGTFPTPISSGFIRAVFSLASGGVISGITPVIFSVAMTDAQGNTELMPIIPAAPASSWPNVRKVTFLFPFLSEGNIVSMIVYFTSSLTFTGLIDIEVSPAIGAS